MNYDMLRGSMMSESLEGPPSLASIETASPTGGCKSRSPRATNGSPIDAANTVDQRSKIFAQISNSSGNSATPNPSKPPHIPAALPLHRGAHELKFLLDEKTAAYVRDWACDNLEADPHISTDVADGYHVNNLYLDTPSFDVFHRTPKSGRRKFRIRRYGSDSQLWLEEKRKRKGCVFKRRVLIDESELHERLFGADEPEWIGEWFRKRLDRRRLGPACQVTYRRFARVRPTSNGPIRLTMDDRLHAAPAEGWRVPSAPVSSQCLLAGRVILELKFVETMPALYRTLIDDLRLSVGSFSKYRTSTPVVVPADVLNNGRTTPGAFHA